MIYPVILCGGSGTRLWPLSRQNSPKQFAKIFGDGTLFQASARRLSGKDFALPVLVTSEQHRHLAIAQLTEAGIDAGAVLVEPEPRNTAPAILAAALFLLTVEDDPVMLVTPSDQVIPEDDLFRATVISAFPAAREGKIVTFGIVPTRPETGYGYLELLPGSERKLNRLQTIARFVEKPDALRAAEMLLAGNYLWNAGIFLFSARAIVQAFVDLAPEMVEPARKSLDMALRHGSVVKLAAEPWSELPDLSIDYAIMEKAECLLVMPYSGRWSDLGSWEAVCQESSPDDAGNVVQGNALALDCKASMLRTDGGDVQVVGIGLEGIVAVATGDAVLVARTTETQRVKDAIKELKARGIRQAASFPHELRPWGNFETLARGARYHVKRIVVLPGGRLSLQSHRFRAEHWIVVEGTARVTVGDSVKTVNENESVYVPLGEKHRLENPGVAPLVLVEVQTGSYFGEDDIIRYEDIYARQ